MRQQLVHARAMRREPTPAEALLWRQLRHRKLGFEFRRQHPIGGYILDFYAPVAQLAVELDGGGHNDEAERIYDEQRDAVLAARGVRVLRFWNPEVAHKTELVLQVIYDCLRGAPLPARRARVELSPRWLLRVRAAVVALWAPTPLPPPLGEGEAHAGRCWVPSPQVMAIM